MRPVRRGGPLLHTDWKWWKFGTLGLDGVLRGHEWFLGVELFR